MHYPTPDPAKHSSPISEEAQEALTFKQPERQQFVLDRLHESLPSHFDDDYIQHIIGSHPVTSV